MVFNTGLIAGAFAELAFAGISPVGGLTPPVLYD
jgi:mannose/fructose/N-acetylgalactosamine-specific phosphotransferase system component IIC